MGSCGITRCPLASGRSEQYVGQLQSEIEAEYGADGLPPKPANARNGKIIKLRKQWLLKPESKELWERIKHKTRYVVKIDTERLLAATVTALNGAEVKKQFVEALERREDVKLYLKLPRWFEVPTPAGHYNPDWAIVMEDRDEHGHANGRPLLCLVRETKDTTNLGDLRAEERRKILCGKSHFTGALGVDYRVVTSASMLP